MESQKKVNTVNLSQLRFITVLIFLVVNGCDKSPRQNEVTSTRSASVPQLLERLPNFKSIGIQSVNFVIKTHSVSSRLPSPSDSWESIEGWAILTTVGAGKLKTDYDWDDVPREDLPLELLELIPEGNVRVSGNFNETFRSNPKFVYGVSLMTESESWSRIYFVVNDIDGPFSTSSRVSKKGRVGCVENCPS